MDSSLPWAEALAIDGDRIAWVGRDYAANDWIGPDTRVIEVGRRLVLPGLIDSHFHLLEGARGLRDAQLGDAASIEDVQRTVRAFAAAHPDRDWVTGRGWRYGVFPPGAAPHRSPLDAIVPDRPCYLIAFDGHTAWANTVALERAGLLLGPADSPAYGGVVMGDDGTATGELREPPAMDPVRRLIPPPTPDEDAALVGQALAMCASFGITSVHDMDGDASSLSTYRALDERGALSARIYASYSVDPGAPEGMLDDWVRATGALPSTSHVRTGCMKFLADGVVETKTACMLEPYDDGSGDRGRMFFAPDAFRQLVARADRLGQQVFVHAIGDAAVRAALDAFDHAKRMNGPRDSRHRIEHIEVLDPVDPTGFKRARAIASVQPLHVEFALDADNPWRRLVGPKRWAWAFPWRALISAGAPLAFGSDWPVLTMNPFEAMRAALARPKLDFSATTSHFPDHRLTLSELIEGYTRAAAYAEFQERRKGQIMPGLLADVVALDQNWFDAPREELPAAIASTRADLTIVGGRVVHNGL
jgi:predicted amidohydrolase YtcJ